VHLGGRFRGVDMYSTCDYRHRMGTMIQIRNVPAQVHRRLKAKAALCGRNYSPPCE